MRRACQRSQNATNCYAEIICAQCARERGAAALTSIVDTGREAVMVAERCLTLAEPD